MKKNNWSNKDLNALKILLKNKTPIKIIALTLNCPLSKVYNKIYELTGERIKEIYKKGKYTTTGPLLKQEKEELFELVNEGKTSGEIAQILNRTIDSVKHHRSVLFPSISNVRLWTKKDDEELISLTNEGFTNKQIAQILNRTVSSIESHKTDLKQKKEWNISVKNPNGNINSLISYYKDLGFKKITIIIE